LQQQFGLSPAKVQLCLSLNFVTYCIGSLYASALGDKYGLRKVILYGLAVFVLGSVACCFAADFSYILAGRILQGLGMAAPAPLGYVIIAERYSPEKQASMLGTLNGCITVAMAFAPVIGSYVAIYAGWRGNFAVLLLLALVALGFCLFVLPEDDRKRENVSLSLSSYLILFQSKTFLKYLVIVCAYICSYWTFIGMGSILYIEGFGVTLANFGFYQGAIAGSFAVISFLSPKLLSKFGHQKCFKISIILITIVAVLIGFAALLGINNPVLITTLMCLFALPMVLPVNILYPLILEVVPETKSRAAAVVNVARLVVSAICIESVSYAYNGTFLYLGLLILGLSIVGMIFARSVKLAGRTLN
jgi:DHA1 family bicyclomycin/chloramphenicol resistance-like MFS transporter